MYATPPFVPHAAAKVACVYMCAARPLMSVICVALLVFVWSSVRPVVAVWSCLIMTCCRHVDFGARLDHRPDDIMASINATDSVQRPLHGCFQHDDSIV